MDFFLHSLWIIITKNLFSQEDVSRGRLLNAQNKFDSKNQGPRIYGVQWRPNSGESSHENLVLNSAHGGLLLYELLSLFLVHDKNTPHYKVEHW